MIPAEVDIRKEIWSINKINELLNNNILIRSNQISNELDINNFSELICSLLLRIPFSAVYAYWNNNDQISIVRGYQKLNIINKFINDEFIYEENNYFPNLFGLKYSEFPLRYKRIILETYIYLYIIRDGCSNNIKNDLINRFSII